MEHTQVPCERWHSESRNVARDVRTWAQVSKRVDEEVKREVTASCVGTGMERPVEEIASLAADAGVQGVMCLGTKVCPKRGDTLHPLGFANHVKKCDGTRRNYHIMKRSKTCSICGVSMNRESIGRHEAPCRAKREDLKPAGPVRRRITGKRPAGPGQRQSE